MAKLGRKTYDVITLTDDEATILRVLPNKTNFQSIGMEFEGDTIAVRCADYNGQLLGILIKKDISSNTPLKLLTQDEYNDYQGIHK